METLVKMHLLSSLIVILSSTIQFESSVIKNEWKSKLESSAIVFVTSNN